MNNANNASAGAGSAANVPGAATGQTGGGAGFDYEKGYKELEAKMGGMGEELGEYRNFFQSISPLLDKLDQNPTLVQAIIDGKIDKELAEAVKENRITVGEAAVVSQAATEVKQDVGKALADLTPEKITALIDSKTQEIRKELEEKADLKNFEDRTQEFIKSTTDFADYADAISDWLDKHDVTDVEVAYYAVKGQMGEGKAKEMADAAAAERAQEVAANAGGGGVTSQAAVDGIPLIDRLVGGPSNPRF